MPKKLNKLDRGEEHIPGDPYIRQWLHNFQFLIVLPFTLYYTVHVVWTASLSMQNQWIALYPVQ